MNSALAYYSVTGHSGKIANAIGEALQIPVYDLKKNPDISDCDLLFLVSGIYGGAANPKMLAYFKKLDGGKVRKAALLTTSAGGETPQRQAREMLQALGIQVFAEEYTCLGTFFIFRRGHPNQQEIAEAVAFTRRVIESEFAAGA
ncbi:MAG: flavodoxin domain-containing protein [Anaerolineaceae bacterium]